MRRRSRNRCYDRRNTHSYNGLGDRVRVVKPTGTRHFVYDTQGRVVAEYGASASEVKAVWHRQLAAVGREERRDAGIGRNHAAIATPVTSAQCVNAWVQAERTVAALAIGGREKTLAI
jgi:YD repeat-containing protein